MTVERSQTGAVSLKGDCGLDDAEPFMRLLLEAPDAAIDWRGCRQAHTAIVQLIMASGRTLLGPPDNRFLETLIEPLLCRQGD